MNPVVAVLVGWTLAGEPIGAFAVAALVIILVGVAMVNAGHREQPALGKSNRDEEAQAEAAA